MCGQKSVISLDGICDSNGSGLMVLGREANTDLHEILYVASNKYLYSCRPVQRCWPCWNWQTVNYSHQGLFNTIPCTGMGNTRRACDIVRLYPSVALLVVLYCIWACAKQLVAHVQSRSFKSKLPVIVARRIWVSQQTKFKHWSPCSHTNNTNPNIVAYC